MRPRPALMIAALLFAVPLAARAQPAPDPLGLVQRETAAAEQALGQGELQLAESHYRGALYAGWMTMGSLAAADGRFGDAREAFTRASTSVVESGDALQSLAMIDLQLNDAAAALPILTRLVSARHQPALQRLLAQALVAAKQVPEAVQMLEEAHGAAPDDLETTFALATGYLRVGKAEAAHQLFDALAAAMPRPETWVLIGRAYRDAGKYGDARTALTRALAMDPRVKHAHYYLGTAAVMDEGIIRVDEAIADFRRELAISPGDPAATLLLSMALVEGHKEREALPLLEAAAREPGAGWRTFQYLGRCQLALGHGAEAAAALRKAIDLSADVPVESRIGNLHYQLAQALRLAGDAAGAAAEFATASSSAATLADTRRDTLQKYLADAGDRPGAGSLEFSVDSGALGRKTADERRELQARTATALARAYLNLGIMQAQASRFARAADLLKEGARLDPELPQLQYSLGVACFNAHQYAPAAAALERALATDASNQAARRMLALASLNTEAFARAAELLEGDPDLQRDPSLQYAYGVALVHGGRVEDAERLFSTLLAQHADSPQLNVLVGEAHAEQGDYDGAMAALKRALALDPAATDANRTLGVIYMKQGKLTDAAAALRAELASHPDDLRSRYTLATVLDLDGHQPEALAELARVLQARPDDADARYLTGKIQLARGSAADAVEHLEMAARLAPADANIQYQLGQAYQKLGRTADAQKAFDRFQQLKDKRRGGGA